VIQPVAPTTAEQKLARKNELKARGYDLSDQAKEGPNYALMAYSTASSDSEVVKKDNGAPIFEDWKLDDEDKSVP
nr:hypothetical protein [Tanacetum cinerariifolium]